MRAKIPSAADAESGSTSMTIAAARPITPSATLTFPATLPKAGSRCMARPKRMTPTGITSSPTSSRASKARRQHARALLARLSEREREVAITVGQGRSNAEISSELFMSVATVKQHVSRILTKLDLNNRTQIALLAHDAGLAGTA
jgi:DNA-binding NarL/FixJ family response regulator